MKIVGLGAISSLGRDLTSLSDLHGHIPPMPDRPFKIPHLEETPFYQGKLEDNLAVSSYKLAIMACQDALCDSGISSRKIAFLLATGAGDTEFMEKGDCDHNTPYELAERVVSKLSIEGVYVTVSNACSSASYALALAYDLLNEGHDAVLLCGVEGKSATTQATFKSLFVLDNNSCRPFEEDRNGTVLGCGAAAILLSNTKYDISQKCYARVSSVSTTCDAYHATSPEPSGEQMKRCIDEVLTRSDVKPQQVTLFVPHATGTQLNDAIEEQLLKKIFPDTFNKNTALLVKKYLGHTGGGSAAFSLLVAAMSLWYSNKNNHRLKHDYALINSTAFGGNNSCILLEAVNNTK
jgi:3-oxoacyl-[acyl-carrier-protein] synthase II